LESRRQRGRRKRITCLQGIRPCCAIREERRRTRCFGKPLCVFARGLDSDSVAPRNVDLDSDDKVIAPDKPANCEPMLFPLDLAAKLSELRVNHPPITEHGLLGLTIPGN
jgi:hypothetical protein